MNIAICDDRADDREHLSTCLHQFFSGRGEEIGIFQYSTGEALLADMEDEYAGYALIFQDIYLEGMTGVETARKLREHGCKSKIVFLTTSPDFALEGYDVEASGYLLKPLDQEKLNDLLERILPSALRKQIELSLRGHYTYLFQDEIMWIESRNNNVLIHMQDQSVLEYRGKLSDMEHIIGDESFLRCHQSYLINMNYVIQVDHCFHMKDGSLIPIRVRSRKKHAEEYHHWFLSRF